MKKLVVILSLLLMLAPCVNADDNAILYCNFEGQDKYFQNGDKEYSTYTKLSVSQAPGEGADATGGLKIDAENENSSMVTKIYQDAAVNSNLNTSDKYMLSFYAKVPQGSNISGIDVYYRYNRLLNTVDVPIVSQAIDGSDYVRISAEFTIASISRFSLVIKPVGTGTLYIDEFMIGKMVAPKMVKEECIPPDGAVDVERTEEIYIAFNKVMDADSLDDAQILINGSAENIERIAMSEDGKGCTITLKEKTEYETDYTVSVSGITDMDKIEVSDSFSFTTGEERGETVAFIDYDTSNPSRYTSWRRAVNRGKACRWRLILAMRCTGKSALQIRCLLDLHGRTVRNLENSFSTISEFDIGNAKLLVDGSERTLKLSELTNNTSQTRELVLKIIAVKDGELLKSVQKTISIPALGTIDAYLTLDLSDVTVAGYTVKGLLWDEKYGIMPVIKHLE